MITYRQATVDDSADLVSLLEEIMQHHGATPQDPARLAGIVGEALASPLHDFVVADDDGDVVAMCALVFTLSTWSAGLIAEVQDVIVREAVRRKRIGRGLLLAAERVARERECARMYLMAESWNLDAHAFYRGLGLMEKTSLYFERDLKR